MASPFRRARPGAFERRLSDTVRLLHLHSGNIYGGIETMLVTMARESASRNDRCLEFALCFGGRLHDELTAVGFEPVQLGAVRLRQPNSMRRVRQRLRSVLAERRPDAVIVHGPWAQAVFGAEVRRAGTRLVLWLHGPSTGVIHQFAVRTPPDAVICNSATTERSMPRAYAGVPRTIVHCPVSRPAIQSPDSRERVRESLGARFTDVVIVQASRLEGWKGHEVHIRALGRLRALDGWIAWIAGGAGTPAEAAYQKRLQAIAREEGIASRVTFLGERRDMDQLLAAADVYCQPNTAPEPFGIAYIEAMWAGLPVVASDAGGPREIVTPDCGIVVTPGDVPALAGALSRLVGDPALRGRLGGAGPMRAETLCNPARQISRAREFIGTAVSSKAVVV
jgi:glycosyltransferase involved in cell wall biosynthesis